MARSVGGGRCRISGASKGERGRGEGRARGRRAGHPRVLIAQFSYIFANYYQNKTLQRHVIFLLRIPLQYKSLGYRNYALKVNIIRN